MLKLLKKLFPLRLFLGGEFSNLIEVPFSKIGTRIIEVMINSRVNKNTCQFPKKTWIGTMKNDCVDRSSDKILMRKKAKYAHR